MRYLCCSCNILPITIPYFKDLIIIVIVVVIIINKVHFPISVLKTLVINYKIKLHKHWWAEKKF